jgi:hypothetical protein
MKKGPEMASTDTPSKGEKPGTAPDASTIVTNDQAAPSVAAEPEAEADVSRPPLSSLTGIKYSAKQVDRKTLTAKDLQSLGVEDPKSADDLVWSRDNGFVVPIDSVNAATVDALIKLPGFSAV